tara:strand:- start:1570 stop:2466 length:897 start_codon:yes stop_codon:yes gene_type:complete
MTEEQAGNSIPANEASAEEAVFDSGDFFSELEDSVNGMQTDGEVRQTQEVTQPDVGPEQVTQNTSTGTSVNWDDENNPYKQRYKDSSREAVRINDELKDLKPFVPVLEAMKRDSGLVEHVRNYLQGGGQPQQGIKDQLNLPEDFEFDAEEAMKNPESASAKVQNAHIDQIVQGRVNQMMSREKENAKKMQAQFLYKKQEDDFKKKHNMSDEKFEAFKKAAAAKPMTLDDAYYLINRDMQARNIANNTKKDMLGQMQNVRNIPTSASDSNNQGNSQKTPDQKVFDNMLGLDEDVDNLFG